MASHVVRALPCKVPACIRTVGVPSVCTITCNVARSAEHHAGALEA